MPGYIKVELGEGSTRRGEKLQQVDLLDMTTFT